MRSRTCATTRKVKTRWYLKISWRSSNGNSTSDRKGDTNESHVVCIYDSSSRQGFNNTSFPDQTRARKVKLRFDNGHAEDRSVGFYGRYRAKCKRHQVQSRVLQRWRTQLRPSRNLAGQTDELFSGNDDEPRFNFLDRSKRGSYLAGIVIGTRIDCGNPGRFKRRKSAAKCSLARRERGSDWGIASSPVV